MEKVIVTRHPALLSYIKELGLIDDQGTVACIMHVTDPAREIAGKHVIGVLPLHLAALATKVTEIPLNLPPNLRGKELTLEQVRQYAQPPVTYQVTALDS